MLSQGPRDSRVFSEECSLERSCAAWSTLEWFSEVDDMEKLDDVSTRSRRVHCLTARLRSRARALHPHDRNTPDPLYIFYIDFSISDLYSDIYKGDGIETRKLENKIKMLPQ